MGAATAEKGLDLVFAAMGLLLPRLPQAKLLIMQSSQRTTKGNLISIAGNARRNIHFPPTQEDVFLSLHLDLFWSRHAPKAGSAALMAMAHGVPVLESRAGGLPEVVENGKTGMAGRCGHTSVLAEITYQAAIGRTALKHMK